MFIILQDDDKDKEKDKDNNTRSVAGLFDRHSRSTAIDFGAEQVIIVRDQQAKTRLLAQIRRANGSTGALVLTVLEAKGLEFKDVLIYNFFKDGGLNWRVASVLLQEEGEAMRVGAQAFDSKRHAGLVLELKLLCTYNYIYIYIYPSLLLSDLVLSVAPCSSV